MVILVYRKSYILYLLIGGTIRAPTLILEITNFCPLDIHVNRLKPLDLSWSVRCIPREPPTRSGGLEFESWSILRMSP
jgi:hypothetical protein